MKVVIVGGVAGGASAAARLRRMDERAEIIIIERSGYVSYANCGLPYFIGDVITERSELTLQTPESLRARFNIDVRVNQEVVAINREANSVQVHNLKDGSIYTETYDKLVLSPGAHPVVPDVPGAQSPQVFTLRTVEDTFAIHDYIAANNVRSVAVVGGGFIGLEVAENLVERGLGVTLYQRPNHVLPILDKDIAAFVHNHLRAKGVDLRLQAGVQSFEEHGHGIAVQTEAGSEVFDMVVLAIGVAPENKLAAEAGLELGVKGTVVVNEHLRTSDPDIFALGDAIQVKHLVSAAPAHIALAGPANKQGRIVADVIAGRLRSFKGSMVSSVLKVFDLTVAATGLNAAAATRAGLAFNYVLLSPPSHASYYPGASAMRLKVLFEQGTGRVLGAQAVGREGVEKRIDVIATAIQGGMDVHDLAELDLTYAPPYSSAKDPVNMAGFMASNVMDGLVAQVQWEEAVNRVENEVLLDVRTEGEYAAGHVEGALHIPVDSLRERLGELPKEKRILVHCQSGLRSYVACRILMQHGFNCANVAGGYVFYEAATTDKEAAANVGSCGL